MPIIADADVEILELFAGKQDAAHIKMRDGDDYIAFCERRYDDDTESTRTTYYDIKQSVFDDIKSVFTGILRFLPFAKHLLLILWIREFQFGLGSLKDDDMYDVIQNTFAYSGVDINDETVAKEFFALFREGYVLLKLKFDLGEKTLSRKPYKDMIAKFARDKDRVPSTGKKSYLGKGERATKSSNNVPDNRRSHEDEVDDRLDGISDT